MPDPLPLLSTVVPITPSPVRPLRPLQLQRHTHRTGYRQRWLRFQWYFQCHGYRYPGQRSPFITGQVPLSVQENQPLTLVVANLVITDPDDVPADMTLTVQSGANYTVSGNTITPAAGFNGTLTVPVYVNDGSANSNTFNLSVTVIPVNDPPSITGQVPLSTTEDTPLTLVSGNFTITDIDNAGPFTLTVNSGANYSVAGTTITPAANYSGTLTVPVTVSDPGGAVSDIFNASVTVTPVNDPPVITGQVPLSVQENQPLTTRGGQPRDHRS